MWPQDAYLIAPPAPLPPPHGDLYWYVDDQASMTLGADQADGTAILRWGSATNVGTPLLVTDLVTGGPAVWTSASDYLITAAGLADFLITGEWSAALVWRALHYNPGGEYPLVDSTAGGTSKGAEIRALDNNADITKRRAIVPRVFNGSSYVLSEAPFQTAGIVGNYITLKWHVVIVRVNSVHADISVDGRSVLRVPTAAAWSYLTAGSAGLRIGGGRSHYKAAELYSRYLGNAEIPTTVARLSARFQVDPIIQIAGDVFNVAQFYGFPNLMPNGGKLYLTYFQGANEGPEDANTQHSTTSATQGSAWGNDTVIQANGPSVRYADIGTLIMSNGHWLQTTYLYDAGGNITHLAARTSTDAPSSGNTPAGWSAWRDVSLGSPTPQWQATGAPPVEDPANPGHIHWPVYALENAETKSSIWDYISTDFGDTFPTRYRIANGDTDSRNYQEPNFLFETGYIYCLTRQDASPFTMMQSRSTDGGPTWAAMNDTGMQATSAARGLRKLASGRYIWPGARPNAVQEAAIYSRDPGAAWNDPWDNVPDAPWVDPLYGGSAYGGAVETSPGEMTLVWGANIDATHDDVVGRVGFREFYLTRALPGDVEPATASKTVGQTLNLRVKGAGPFSYAVTGTSGGSCTGGGVYTAGVSNGTDTITVTDTNGKTAGTCVVTVSGASASPTPSAIYPDAGISGHHVMILGTRFISGGATGATVGGVAVTSFVVVDDNTITGVVGAHAEGDVNVVVHGTGGDGTLVNGFTYVHTSLVRHYDPAYTPSITQTTTVSAIADICGSGEAQTQATGGNQPTINATGINGKPSLTNTASTGLAGSKVPWVTTALTFATIIKTSSAQEQRILGARYTSDHGMLEIEASTGLAIYQTADSTTAKSNAAVNDGAAHALVATLNTAGDQTARLFVDGTTAASTTAVSATAYNWNDSGSGNADGDANCYGTSDTNPPTGIFKSFVGDLGPAFVFSQALTGSSLTVLVNYLKRRGGIA